MQVVALAEKHDVKVHLLGLLSFKTNLHGGERLQHSHTGAPRILSFLMDGELKLKGELAAALWFTVGQDTNPE